MSTVRSVREGLAQMQSQIARLIDEFQGSQITLIDRTVDEGTPSYSSISLDFKRR